MQTPAEMLRRANAARPQARSVAEETKEKDNGEVTQKRLVMNPVKTNGVYRSLMEKHDRTGTRHLG